MSNLHEVKNNLDLYFSRLKAQPKELRLYSDEIDDNNNPVVFLRLRQGEHGSYEVCYENRMAAQIDRDDDEEEEDASANNWRTLTKASLKKEHLSIALISDAIKKHNNQKKDRRNTILKILTCVALGLLMAGLIAAAIFTGGTSLLPTGGAIMLIVGSGAATSLLSWLGIKQLNKWFRSFNPAPEVPRDTWVYKPFAKTGWQRLLLPLSLVNEALKWLARSLFLDNFVSKFIFGNIIAAVANSGNPHYKIDAKPVTETLGSLIFAAGLQTIKVNRDGSVYLGPVLGIQHRNYQTFLQEQPRFAFQSFHVGFRPGMVMDGMEATNGLAADQDSLNIIYFNGNSGCYEDARYAVEDDLEAWRAERIAVKAIQFNYPGVLKSTGKIKVAADLIEAGIAQVERLRAQGVPYDKIALHGVSLGGSLVSHVASYYHSRGIELAGTYASKTFSSTTNVAVSYLQKIPVAGHLLGFLLRPLIAFGLWGSRWQLDTAAHFTSLPENKREYSLVRSSRNIRREYQPKDDPVLAHYASLHESWRLRLDRFFHKRGWFGKDAATYRQINRQRKMSAFMQSEPDLPAVFSPQTCGHSQEQSYGVILHHRNIGENEGAQVRFPANLDTATHEQLVFAGPTSRQRFRGFFGRMAAAHQETHLDVENSFDL